MTLSEAKRLCSQGQQKLAAGDFQGAIAKFKQALQFNPNDYLALCGLGDVMMQLNRYEEAIAYCDQLLMIRPSDHKALHRRGAAFFGLGQYKQALTSLDKAQKSNSACAVGWHHLGSTLHTLKQYDEAIKSFDKALELDRKDHLAWGNRSNALYESGAYEEALKSSRQALSLQPDNDYYQCLHGQVLHNLRHYKEALENFNCVLERSPNNHGAWYGKGISLDSLKQYQEALISFNQAIAINPNFLNAWSRRGIVLGRLGHNSDAFASHSKALELDPNNADAWGNQGVTLDDLGCYEEAIRSHDQAIRIDPSLFGAWNNRGSSLDSLEQHEQAIESFIQASQLDPQQPTAWSGQGDALSSLGRLSEAKAAYEKALDLDPNNPSLWIRKGHVLRRQSFFHKAIAACENALGLDDQLSSAWTTLGLSIWETQGFEAAIEKLDEAFLKLRQESPQYLETCGKLYGWKGYIYYREGQKQEDCFKLWRKAASFYQMALRSLEQPKFQENYLETLQSLTKVFLGLGQVEEAEVLLAEGTERLQRLLDPEKIPSPGKRKLLALKFAGFDQLTVDRHIQAVHQLKEDAEINAKLHEALATAEKGKNACLSWLLYALNDEVASPGYEEMQQLLSPGTAIVYWHLSPAALTTFVLKPGEAAPIVITQPASGDRPASLQQLLKLEAWMKEWDDQYQDYRSKGKDQRDANHSWRKDMAQRLSERQEEPGNLKEILNIGAIEQHLDGINHLILVPHRDLHRFPLHALFDSRFIVSYLPSIQVGIQLQQQQPSGRDRLLSIENPTSLDQSSLGFARIEAEGIYHCFNQFEAIREKEADKKQVEAALEGGFNVFHFAGHAEHIPTDPQKSRLLLAPANNTPSENADVNPSPSTDLTLKDLQDYDLSTYDLVTLSACETAITRHQTITTEYVGLVSGFLRSGAAQVVSTLWTVESAASALVMIEFYRRRQPSKSDSHALAEAINWLRHLTGTELQQWRADFLAQLPETLLPKRKAWIKQSLLGENWDKIQAEPVFSNPYYWAAFTISGRLAQ